MHYGSCLCGKIRYRINQAKAHTFVSDKASWEYIGDGLPQYDEWAPKEVLVQVGSRQP